VTGFRAVLRPLVNQRLDPAGIALLLSGVPVSGTSTIFSTGVVNSSARVSVTFEDGARCLLHRGVFLDGRVRCGGATFVSSLTPAAAEASHLLRPGAVSNSLRARAHTAALQTPQDFTEYDFLCDAAGVAPGTAPTGDAVFPPDEQAEFFSAPAPPPAAGSASAAAQAQVQAQEQSSSAGDAYYALGDGSGSGGSASHFNNYSGQHGGNGGSYVGYDGVYAAPAPSEPLPPDYSHPGLVRGPGVIVAAPILTGSGVGAGAGSRDARSQHGPADGGPPPDIDRVFGPGYDPAERPWAVVEFGNVRSVQRDGGLTAAHARLQAQEDRDREALTGESCAQRMAREDKEEEARRKVAEKQAQQQQRRQQEGQEGQAAPRASPRVVGEEGDEEGVGNGGGRTGSYVQMRPMNKR